jgi:hypothetical protein
MHSSLEEELVAVLAAALSTTEDLPPASLDVMAQLAYLNDEELWQTAQMTLATEENTRMQALMLKRQSEGLFSNEQDEAENYSNARRRSCCCAPRHWPCYMNVVMMSLHSYNPLP